MNCASCSTLLPDNAQFCPGCGQRILGQRHATLAAPTATRAPTAAPTRRTLPKDELDAAIAARRELGDRMEDDVIDAFLDRVETSLDTRVDRRVDEQLHRLHVTAGERGKAMTGRIAASLGIGIPLTAIAGGIGGVAGIVAIWVSIVVLNIYYTEVEKSRD